MYLHCRIIPGISVGSITRQEKRWVVPDSKKPEFTMLCLITGKTVSGHNRSSAS
jgi:hypothetical protein